ncbi:hypothetical protein TNCV_2790851 [Trichonephila clavipes]|nr:hypothetical protein TNCV_2790851 [Trichonephila clavipes]
MVKQVTWLEEARDPSHGKPLTAASAMSSRAQSLTYEQSLDCLQAVFSDESRFNLWDHDDRTRVRRYSG